ncbi:hypothetical protein TorRG33x02_062930 [Trema orientale]|uniref:Uncharacterized protein n=1 Tax=Trema orientale TaxID=63057 RepID=A0A2P5FJK4_TREOI|nr:hypothetical protein TorRG33x02_062930 [Trema orientale]
MRRFQISASAADMWGTLSITLMKKLLKLCWELPEHAEKEIDAAEFVSEKMTQLVAASTSRVLSNNSATDEDDKTDRNTTNLSARPGNPIANSNSKLET